MISQVRKDWRRAYRSARMLGNSLAFNANCGFEVSRGAAESQKQGGDLLESVAFELMTERCNDGWYIWLSPDRAMRFRQLSDNGRGVF